MGWPSRKKITEAQRELLEPIRSRFTGDISDSCWACGSNVLGVHPARAHIVARSRDGTLEPGNFLLLCSTCHKEHPDGASREEQIDWLYSREDWRARHRRFTEPIVNDLERLSVEAGNRELYQWFVWEHGGDDDHSAAIGLIRYQHEALAVVASTRLETFWANVRAATVRSFRVWLAGRRAPLIAFAWGFAAVAWMNILLPEWTRDHAP